MQSLDMVDIVGENEDNYTTIFSDCKKCAKARDSREIGQDNSLEVEQDSDVVDIINMQVRVRVIMSTHSENLFPLQTLHTNLQRL